MSKLFKHILVVLGLTILLSVLIDKAIFEFFFSYHKRTKLDIQGLKKEIVFFGSSRCIHHIDPIIVDIICDTKSYNMGWAASNPREIYAAIKIYLKRNEKPKLICIQVDQEHNDETEDGLARQSLLKFYGKHYIDDYYSNELKRELSIPLYPSIKYRDFGWREILKTLFNNSNIANKELGFLPIIEQHNVKQYDYAKFKIIKPNKWISKSITFCKENNINVLLFTAPIWKLNANIKFENIRQLYPVDYINFSDSLQKVQYYSDGTHLNRKGAEVFTKIFSKQLIVIKKAIHKK